MYYNVVYADLMIKGLVRVFLSPLKKKSFCCYANETYQIKEAYFTSTGSYNNFL